MPRPTKKSVAPKALRALQDYRQAQDKRLWRLAWSYVPAEIRRLMRPGTNRADRAAEHLIATLGQADDLLAEGVGVEDPTPYPR